MRIAQKRVDVSEVPDNAIVDVVGFTDVERRISASKNVDLMHAVADDDDAIVSSCRRVIF